MKPSEAARCVGAWASSARSSWDASSVVADARSSVASNVEPRACYDSVPARCCELRSGGLV
eukprot:15280193-Heterocapsa_arctica.AAC.1